MAKKNAATAKPWVDPDDAPVMSAKEIARADIYEGAKLVKRGRGRPKLEKGQKKIAVNVRLPPAVVAHFRATGPGWQTRIGETITRAVAKKSRAAGRSSSPRAGVVAKRSLRPSSS